MALLKARSIDASCASPSFRGKTPQKYDKFFTSSARLRSRRRAGVMSMYVSIGSLYVPKIGGASFQPRSRKLARNQSWDDFVGVVSIFARISDHPMPTFR